MKKRYLTDSIAADLRERMVFIAGPRQVGKTTIAQYIGKDYFPSFAYLNWDYQPDRKKIINFKLPAESKLLIFDELHKYKNWKTYIKGIFDKYKERFKILVTGSAKFDIYRQGGDSLFGRYFFYLLHPFSLGEVLQVNNKIKLFDELAFVSEKKAEAILQALLEFGGFPEPFLRQNRRFWRRWQAERLDRLVKEEIREMVQISDLSNLQVLVEILPERVSSLLSINNLRENLQVAHKTAVSYLGILERFYFHFRLYPFAKTPIKSLRKRAKLYLWDWSIIEDKGARFENLIASHLLKFVDFLKNTQGYHAQLFYLRDLEGREVDFLVTVKGKPWFAVEVKLQDKGIAKPLIYFGRRLKIPFLYQIVKEPNTDYLKEKVRVISAVKFLTGLR